MAAAHTSAGRLEPVFARIERFERFSFRLNCVLNGVLAALTRGE